MVQGGELGELRRVNWIITNWFRTQQYYDQGGWRATWAGEGGGVLTNQCPHQLDLVQWVCGMPSSVSAHIGLGKYHDIEVEDEVTAYLEYPNGATGIFITTTGEAPGTNRFEVVGQNGKLVSENGKLTFTKNAVSIQAAIRGDGEMSHEVRRHTLRTQALAQNQTAWVWRDGGGGPRAPRAESSALDSTPQMPN